MVDLVRPVQLLLRAPTNRVHLKGWCEDDRISALPFGQVTSNLRTVLSRHAQAPHLRPHRLALCARCRCVVPQASIFTLREGCACCRWVLLEMVDILDTFVASCARASLDILSEEVAARSDGLATVRGTRAARAALASAGRLCGFCVMHGWTF